MIKMAVFWIRVLENDEWIGPTTQLVNSLMYEILANYALAAAAQPLESLICFGVAKLFGALEAAFCRAAVAGARGS